MKLTELIDALRKHDQSLPVRIEMVGYREDSHAFVFPYSVDSYRGYYEDLAIHYSDTPGASTAWLVGLLEQAIGETYEGYKGGDFTMSGTTRVWCSPYGESTGWAPCEVVSDEVQVTVRAFNIERW
jgi:hypothetical protein